VKEKARRLARLLGWDRNSLRRRTDRQETAIVTGLLAAFLILAPVLAIVAGRVTDDAGLRQQHAERTWHQVPATLLQNADATSATSYDGSGAWIPARWTTPGGQRREGLILADASARAGQRVPVWIDGAGRLTGAPAARGQTKLNVAVAAAATPMILAVVLLLAGCVARMILNRRRLAGWEQAWRVVGPRWTPQR
jgi:hypothetical protein